MRLQLQNKRDLIVRMNLWVITSVSLATIVILLVANYVMGHAYERELRKVLSHHVDATANAVDLCMSGVCRATETVAQLSCDELQDPSLVDSVLSRTLHSMECINAALVIYRPGFFAAHPAGNYGRMAYLDENQDPTTPILLDYMVADTVPNWVHSYHLGEQYMSSPHQSSLTAKSEKQVYYSVPLTDSRGERYGALCVSIKLGWIKRVAINNLASEDFDIGIVAEDGSSIVRHSKRVKKLVKADADALVREHRSLPDLGWTVEIVVTRASIDQNVRRLTQALAFILIILLLCSSCIQLLVVRRVGRPFVKRQAKILEDKAALQRELDIAAAAQRFIVPSTFPPFPDRTEIVVHACLHPALDVGGDLYDFFIREDKLYFCLGDVSGKGLLAAFFMAAARYLFRSVASNTSISDAVGQMNRSLCTDNTQCMFVTFWFGCLDLRNGELQYVNAGHNAPILIQQDGAHYLPVADNLALGVIEEAKFTLRQLTLSPGDKLLLYTDGVTESMDAAGHELGNQATLDTASMCSGMGVEGTIQCILDRVRDHAAGATQSDDITMLCVRYNGDC